MDYRLAVKQSRLYHKMQTLETVLLHNSVQDICSRVTEELTCQRDSEAPGYSFSSEQDHVSK